MRPFYARSSLLGYPIFAGLGATFGYWLNGVQERQEAILADRKTNLLEKRARRAERQAAAEQ